MKKLGVAIIGTGFWGKNHARVYSELEETKLLAVCDMDSKRAEEVGKEYGADPYTKTEKMLAREDIEAVSICTWSTNLAGEALKALQKGKHVLVEKPMSYKVEEAERLLKISKKEGLHLTVGFLMRFIPGIQRIRDSIEKKEIGDLVCATAKRVSQWPERIGDVGVVKDLAIHDIDITRYLFDEEPIAVYAKTGRMKHREHEDYAQIMLTFKGSRNVFIESNWLTPYKTRILVVTGSEAIMKLDFITQELTVEDIRSTVQPRTQLREPLKLELRHFAKCILGKVKPLITGMDGLKALRIAEASLKSSKTSKVIRLD